MPGVRENGGQYTHAAAWAVIAFAMLGDGDKAAELMAMLNPINHTATPAGVDRYQVEPYVVAGDVYAAPPHVGRGGWTWYTGSAGWMYRAGLEWLLGFRLRGDRLILNPCIPATWPAYSMTYRHGATEYDHCRRESARRGPRRVRARARRGRTRRRDGGAAHR